MKKAYLAPLFLMGTFFSYAQVGIKTPNPQSTLDVTATNSTGTTNTVDGLLVPRVDRQRAQSMANVPTSTLIYVNNASSGSQTLTAVNIDAVGYYYFDGSKWVKMHNPSNSPSSSVNIYNSDGTLTGNRIVIQADKTLAFTGTANNAFSVDGNTLSVDAANDRLGIGTTSPAKKLHVEGSGFLNAVVTGAATKDALDINVGQDGIGYGNRTDNFGINMRTASSVNTGSIARINFGDTSTGANNGTRYLSFSVGKTPNELMYLTDANNGKVGIGTITPNSRLDLGASFGSSITDVAGKKLAVYNAADGTDFYGLGISGANLQFHAASTASEAPGMVLNSSGNVGIGNTTPNTRLEVTSGTANSSGIRLTNLTSASPTGTGQTLGVNASGDIITVAAPAAPTSVNIYNADGTLTGNRTVTQGARTLTFSGTSTNAFSVDGNTLSVDAANNRIGVGTTAPTAKVEIVADNVGAAGQNDLTFHGYGTSMNPTISFGSANGTAAAPADLTNGNTIGGVYFSPRHAGAFVYFSAGIRSTFRGATGPTGPEGLSDMVFRTSSKDRLTIDENGNVGIGTLNPTQKLHVIGNIIASGTITPSDIRIKKEITDNTYGLKEILGLRTIGYKYKDENLSKDHKIGFVAQEVKAAMPELVTTADDAMKTLGVNYAEMTVVLTKAVQEQQKQIEELKSEITQLKTAKK